VAFGKVVLKTYISSSEFIFISIRYPIVENSFGPFFQKKLKIIGRSEFTHNLH